MLLVTCRPEQSYQVVGRRWSIVGVSFSEFVILKPSIQGFHFLPEHYHCVRLFLSQTTAIAKLFVYFTSSCRCHALQTVHLVPREVFSAGGPPRNRLYWIELLLSALRHTSISAVVSDTLSKASLYHKPPTSFRVGMNETTLLRALRQCRKIRGPDFHQPATRDNQGKIDNGEGIEKVILTCMIRRPFSVGILLEVVLCYCCIVLAVWLLVL